MSPDDAFVSYAQNSEDVVLWRALRSIGKGRYLEIGANHPSEDSISRPFYDRGWSGITVEPMVELVEAHRECRPRDLQVHALAGRPGVEEGVLHTFAGTGLSTTVDEFRDAHERDGWQAEDVAVRSLTVDQILEEAQHTGDLHFVVIDTEGAEADVLEGFDLRRWRPWVLVIEATVPNRSEPSHQTWEPDVLESGYELCLFDGLSRFYVAQEHAGELASLLSVPANVLDGYVTATTAQAVDAAHRADKLTAELTDELVRWRAAALTRWADVVATVPERVIDTGPATALHEELAAVRRTLSWRITAPLRAARGLLAR